MLLIVLLGVVVVLVVPTKNYCIRWDDINGINIVCVEYIIDSIMLLIILIMMCIYNSIVDNSDDINNDINKSIVDNIFILISVIILLGQYYNYY